MRYLTVIFLFVFLTTVGGYAQNQTKPLFGVDEGVKYEDLSFSYNNLAIVNFLIKKQFPEMALAFMVGNEDDFNPHRAADTVFIKLVYQASCKKAKNKDILIYKSLASVFLGYQEVGLDSAIAISLENEGRVLEDSIRRISEQE